MSQDRKEDSAERTTETVTDRHRPHMEDINQIGQASIGLPFVEFPKIVLKLSVTDKANSPISTIKCRRGVENGN